MFLPDSERAMPSIFLLKSPSGTFTVNSGFLSRQERVKRFSLTNAVKMGVDHAISIISGKWKMHILFWLSKKEVMRYSEIKRAPAGHTGNLPVGA